LQALAAQLFYSLLFFHLAKVFQKMIAYYIEGVLSVFAAVFCKDERKNSMRRYRMIPKKRRVPS
jgi:hypothetical protein